MESELRELRLQIRQKCTVSLKLQNEVCYLVTILPHCHNILLFLSYFLKLAQLELSIKSEDNVSRFYEISGSEKLGSILRIQSCSDEAIELTKCSIQWFRLSSQCSRREPILGINFSIF